MSKGYVYVLSNPSMPGLVKIGRSTHGGRQRARQIDQTGVPLPFVVEFEILVDCPEFIEAATHRALAASRVNACREYFSVSPQDASLAILKEVANDFDYRVDPVDMAVAIDYAAAKAHQIGAHPIIVCSALRFLSDESVREAVSKYESWVERRRAARKVGLS